MEIAIFIFYLLLVSYLITVIPFFKNSGLGKWLLTALFFVKILAGIAYAKFYSLPKYYPTSDTWRFYRLSVEETKWLLQDPVSFAKDLFIYGYNRSGNIFSGENTYWNDLKSNLPVKIMSVFNVITNSSYYTNIILFNFLFLFGLVGLFKVFFHLFPNKKALIVTGIFLLPSTLFWCSGIHKDGLILSALGIILYLLFKGIKAAFSVKQMLMIALCTLLIFALRNHVLLALLPAVVCWVVTERFSWKAIKVFSLVYLSGLILFFLLPYLYSPIDLPLFFANKQREFLLLDAGSAIGIQPLQPSFSGFISFLPTALDMAFLRPHLTEIKNFSYIPAIAETYLLLILIILSIIGFKKRTVIPPVIFAFIFFSVSVLLICGFTIPFTGAIVRYKSFVLPLLITSLLCLSDFSFLSKKTR